MSSVGHPRYRTELSSPGTVATRTQRTAAYPRHVAASLTGDLSFRPTSDPPFSRPRAVAASPPLRRAALQNDLSGRSGDPALLLPREASPHLQDGERFKQRSASADRPNEIQGPVSIHGRLYRTANKKSDIVVIHRHAFFRDCLIQCLEAALKNQNIFPFATVAEWQNSPVPEAPPSVIVVFLDSRLASGGDLSFLDIAMDSPVVVISDIGDAHAVINAMKKGVRGYIPTNLPFNVAVEAVRLVQAGGTFVPPCALEPGWNRQDGQTKANDLLTERQMKVVEALCRGMANKQIAYALQMSEHTVKIHLRHIMRKLNARNRTEVAILANAILNGWNLHSSPS